MECEVCGHDMQVDGTGVSNHISEDGLIDYDRDADHVPYCFDSDFYE